MGKSRAFFWKVLVPMVVVMPLIDYALDSTRTLHPPLSFFYAAVNMQFVLGLTSGYALGWQSLTATAKQPFSVY